MSGWDERRYATAMVDLDGVYGSVSLFHCRDCGAFVAQPDRHDAWHAAETVGGDPWCRSESCLYRHWRSGEMPTHRRGGECPDPTAAVGNGAPQAPTQEEQ